MATSVYFAASIASATSRVLNIGGTVSNQNWADGALVYTVPVGKRLVLKGQIGVTPSFSGGNHRITLGASSAPNIEQTFVLPPGMRLYHDSAANQVVATGFLEDDI